MWVGQCGGGWGVGPGGLAHVVFWATVSAQHRAMWGRRSSQRLLPPRAFWLCPPSSPPASQTSSTCLTWISFTTISIPPGSASKLSKIYPKYVHVVLLFNLTTTRMCALSLNGFSSVWAQPTIVHSLRLMLFFFYDLLIKKKKIIYNSFRTSTGSNGGATSAGLFLNL